MTFTRGGSRANADAQRSTDRTAATPASPHGNGDLGDSARNEPNGTGIAALLPEWGSREPRTGRFAATMGKERAMKGILSSVFLLALALALATSCSSNKELVARMDQQKSQIDQQKAQLDQQQQALDAQKTQMQQQQQTFDQQKAMMDQQSSQIQQQQQAIDQMKADQQREMEEQQSASKSKHLPKTASPLPLIGLGGLASLASGLMLSRRRMA
jgi:cell division protein FtsB